MDGIIVIKCTIHDFFSADLSLQVHLLHVISKKYCIFFTVEWISFNCCADVDGDILLFVFRFFFSYQQPVCQSASPVAFWWVLQSKTLFRCYSCTYKRISCIKTIIQYHKYCMCTNVCMYVFSGRDMCAFMCLYFYSSSYFKRFRQKLWSCIESIQQCILPIDTGGIKETIQNKYL